MKESEERLKNVEHIILDETTRNLASGFKLPKACIDSMTNFSRFMSSYKLPKINSVSEQVGAFYNLSDLPNAYSYTKVVPFAYQIPESLTLGVRMQKAIPELGVPGINIGLENFYKKISRSYKDEIGELTSKINSQIRFLNQGYMPKIQESAFEMIKQRNEIFKPLSQMVYEVYGDIVVNDYKFTDDELEICEELDTIESKEDVNNIIDKINKLLSKNPLLSILVSAVIGACVGYPMTRYLLEPIFNKLETIQKGYLNPDDSILQINTDKEINILDDGDGQYKIQYYDENGERLEEVIEKSHVKTYEKKK